MIEKENTKEKIEQIALELFSRYGYRAVSIRDICKELGFRESSIYYHFANKQAIMDALLEKIESLIETMRNQFDTAFARAGEVSNEDICKVAVGVLNDYLLNPYVYKMIATLTIERMSDQKAADTYQNLVFTFPLEQQEKVFGQMIERGYIKENQAEVLAQEYYSIIYFSFQKNCMGMELTEERKEQARNEIERNMRDLYQKMR
ncbi:TetR/AcrR family transcriptional regulator [Cellulosilyticum sp. WCF-2]|uniref:TetR/AcrR family transcriptional regulator n=1 Tax=Cellulosilyticum sp. WCF-2 TaxID=2497860 RepID=UPI000F8D65BC|nr:TetR/AcrR family transcriptional regulator [Cellulosilyticum sp. WCF-2]QEH70449.1 TetR/AcrR family transcriptional regulator [Cellulosilyticum sp. WCF-2]